MPISLRMAFVVSATVAAALAARAVFHRILRPELAEEGASVSEVVMEAIAALYGVLLAFLLASAWQRLDDARATITLGMNAMANLEQVAELLPPPFKTELGGAVMTYRQHAIEELALAAQHQSTNEPTRSLSDLWSILARYDPQSAAQSELQARAFDALKEIGDQRRLLLNTDRSLPAIVWVVLIGGATVMLVLVAISSRPTLGALYLALLAAIISLALFSIYALSYPLRSGLMAGWM